jgi:uncharacterized protein YcbK (DUF882 family)
VLRPRLALTCCALLAAALGAPEVAAKGAAPKPAPAKAAPAKKGGPVAYSHVWHAVKPGQTAPVDESGRPMLVLQALNMPDRVALTAISEHGGFSAMDLDRAAHVLRDPRTGNEHPVDPRALDLVYRVAVHFGTPEVRIISGYRTPRPGSHSNHGRGRAIDLVFPGTGDDDVARFARELGFVGVGVYPVSGFVHLDVRERSYFWVDSSAPGKKNRERGILGDLASKSDARALARGERGVAPFGITNDVEAALASTKPVAGAAAVEDEDVDD